jgi:hypothetical protein
MDDVSVERDDRRTRGDGVSTDRSLTADCYDAASGSRYPRPRLRGVLHQVSFPVSLVAGPLLVTAAHGTTAKTAAGVYAASVTGLFAPALCTTGSPGGRRHAAGCSDSTTP